MVSPQSLGSTTGGHHWRAAKPRRVAKELRMTSRQPRPLIVCAALLLGATSLAGCATKKFVREQVGVVDTRLGETQGQVTAAQSTITQHETRMGELDRTTREALERAMAA